MERCLACEAVGIIGGARLPNGGLPFSTILTSLERIVGNADRRAEPRKASANSFPRAMPRCANQSVLRPRVLSVAHQGRRLGTVVGAACQRQKSIAIFEGSAGPFGKPRPTKSPRPRKRGGAPRVAAPPIEDEDEGRVRFLQLGGDAQKGLPRIGRGGNRTADYQIIGA